MTTPNRHTDLHPTATSSYREQSDVDTSQQVGSPAEPGTNTEAATNGTTTDARATDTRAPGTGAAPSGGYDESGKDAPGEPLLSQQRSAEYSERWNGLKGGFVDEPRQAVAAADKLVSELLEELQDLFRSQRHDIEHGLDKDEASTEDLRLSLRRYRTFFDRLLSI